MATRCLDIKAYKKRGGSEGRKSFWLLRPKKRGGGLEGWILKRLLRQTEIEGGIKADSKKVGNFFTNLLVCKKKFPKKLT